MANEVGWASMMRFAIASLFVTGVILACVSSAKLDDHNVKAMQRALAQAPTAKYKPEVSNAGGLGLLKQEYQQQQQQTQHVISPNFSSKQLGARNALLIGTSQCGTRATGGNFQKFLEAEANVAIGSVNISYDCGSGRYLMRDTKGWSKSAKNVALQACRGKSPPNLIIVFVGAGEITGEHGAVTDEELKREPQLLVDAVRSGCNSGSPKLLLVPAPLLVSGSKRMARRHEVLRTSMRLAAEQDAKTEFVDLGAGHSFERSDFCSESGNCDRNHFCRLRPGKKCPLLEKVTASIAGGMKHAFAVP